MSSYRNLLAVTALVFAGAAFAQTPPAASTPGTPGATGVTGTPGTNAPTDTPRPMMRRGHHEEGFRMGRHVDTDGDGQISKAEMQAAHERRMATFDRADANKDGKLSRDEMRAFRREHRGGPRPNAAPAPAPSGAAASPNA